jgi:hypothetical protein
MKTTLGGIKNFRVWGVAQMAKCLLHKHGSLPKKAKQASKQEKRISVYALNTRWYACVFW